MKIENKIKNIISGWKHIISKNEIVELVAKDRLTICSTCENNIHGVCSLCLCPLMSKTRSLSEACPIQKWRDPILRQDGNILFRLRSELPESIQQYFPDLIIPEEDWQEFIKENE